MEENGGKMKEICSGRTRGGKEKCEGKNRRKRCLQKVIKKEGKKVRKKEFEKI